ncbi:MAG: DUF4174 domain-containing protein [Bacteroidota bacterium]
MKLFLLLSVLSLSVAMHARAQKVSSAFQLDDYRWKNRLVLIFGSETDSLVDEQLSLLRRAEDVLAERDVLKFSFTDSSPDIISKETEALYHKFNLSDNNRITTILIGKDGSEKLRVKNNVLSVELLLTTIDAMPMRRREMQRQYKP